MPEGFRSFTELLAAARRGDGRSRELLFETVYRELKGIAHRELYRFRRDETFSTTALVNEAYLRLMKHGVLPGKDRLHLLAVASQAMRRLLIDRARERHALKRGGGVRELALDDAEEIAAEQASAEILAVAEALEELGRLDERLAKLVELRFFGGLTDAEIAGILEITDRTVRRDWVKAKGFLYRALGAAPEAG
jgi:RNA polymerase sigma factor (TIGR02999 family)